MAEIAHDARRHRMTLTDVGGTGELTYRRRADRMIVVHTEVPRELSGHGLGGALVRAAADYAREEGLTVVPVCPFAARWLADHPEVASTVTVDWPT